MFYFVSSWSPLRESNTSDKWDIDSCENFCAAPFKKISPSPGVSNYTVLIAIKSNNENDNQ